MDKGTTGQEARKARDAARAATVRLGTRFRDVWTNGPAEVPPRPQLTPEQWQYEQQRRAVTSGVLNAIGIVMLWSLVGVVCLAVFLGALMWTP